jgi:hypothetical protein
MKKGTMNRRAKNLTLLASSLLAFSLTPVRTHAIPIEGGLSFVGAATPSDSNLLEAKEISFGQTRVNDVWGSFESITVGPPSHPTLVDMYSPLQINPVDLPSGPLWTVGGFSLTLTSLTVDLDKSSPTYLSLYGVGVLTGDGFDPTPGDWLASIQTAGSPASFSWNAISGPAEAVPDGGSTAMLLGITFMVLGVLGRLRYSKA